MNYRKRSTFDVVVQNIPRNVTQRELNKKFTSYGEIHKLYFKYTSEECQEATIKFLCEPDALKAIGEHHNKMWGSNITSAKMVVNRHPNKRENAVLRTNHPTNHMPFYKSQFPKGLNSIGPMSLPNLYPAGFNLNSCPPVTSNMPMKPLSTPDVRGVVVTYVENTVTFYGNCSTEISKLDNISSRLQLICPVLPRVKGTPSLSKMYGAVYSGDQLWYRCKILAQKGPGLSYVQFVDYGNCEDVENGRIVELPESISCFPYFAPKCVITSLKLPSDERLCYEGLFYVQENILGKSVSITTTSPVESPVYIVTECQYGDVNIIQTLLQNKFAVPKPKGLAEYENSVSCKPVFGPISVPQPKSLPSNLPNSEVSDSKFKPNVMSAKNNSSFQPRCKKNNGVVNRSKVEKRSHLENTTEISALTQEKDVLQSEVDNLKQKCQMLEASLREKEAEAVKYNIIKELESIASHIQLVNSIRCNPPTNDHDINNALAMLLHLNDSLVKQKNELEMQIEEAISLHQKVLDDIAHCTDKTALDNLIVQKNQRKEELCQCLKKYIDLHESSPRKDKEIDRSAIEEMMKVLKTKEKSTVDVSLENKPTTIESVMLEYNTTMVMKKEQTEMLRKNTNKVHAEFMILLTDVLKCFTLNGSNISNELDKNVPFFSPEGVFTSGKLKSALETLWKALEAEVNSVYSHCDFKNDAKSTLVGCLVRELKNMLDRTSKEELLIHRYRLMLKDLSDNSTVPLMLQDLAQVRQSIKSIKSKLRHTLVDKKDLEEGEHEQLEIKEIDEKIRSLQKTLHEEFNSEDKLLSQLAKSCKMNYPEFEFQHPELCLTMYMNYDGIFKQNWEFEHFTCQKLPDRSGVCYEAIFVNEPVVIKEFLLDSEERTEKLLSRLHQWNSIGNLYLIPILAAFKKGERQMYIVTPKKPTLAEKASTCSKEERCDIIRTVLQGLHAIHNERLVHGMLHPSTVLVDDKDIFLDFCFENKYPVPSSDKEICFQAPELGMGFLANEASDMFAFGCLVLSTLLPDLKFQSQSGNQLDILPHISTIAKQLSSNGCAKVTALLDHFSQNRPSAASLLEDTFTCDIYNTFMSIKPEVSESASLETILSSPATTVSIPEPKPVSTEVIASPVDTASQNKTEGDCTLAKLTALRESLGCATNLNDVISSESDMSNEFS